jgi:predicted ABC-type ATPase
MVKHKLGATLDLQPRVIIIAGPNGAGKTTFAKEFLPREGVCTHFVNADLIAAGLSPFDPDAATPEAGRLMVELIRQYVHRRENFAIESTLSGHRYARLIPQWQKSGYRVELIYLRLRSMRLALARVAARVAHGGHSVKSNVVRRRYKTGWENFQTVYRGLVDYWELHDNSGKRPRLIEKGESG